MAKHSFFDHLTDNPTFLVKESLQLITCLTIGTMLQNYAKGNDSVEFSNILYSASQIALATCLGYQTVRALAKTILDCPLSDENKPQKTL